MEETKTTAVEAAVDTTKQKMPASSVAVIIVAAVAIIALMGYFIDPFSWFHNSYIDDEKLSGTWLATMVGDQEFDGESIKSSLPIQNIETLNMNFDFPNKSVSFTYASLVFSIPFEREENSNEISLQALSEEDGLRITMQGEIAAVKNTYEIKGGTFSVEIYQDGEWLTYNAGRLTLTLNNKK